MGAVFWGRAQGQLPECFSIPQATGNPVNLENEGGSWTGGSAFVCMCGGWKEGTEWGLHQAPHLGGWHSLWSRCFLPHCTLRSPLFAPSLSQYFSHEPVSFPSCSQHHPGTSFLFLERWQRGSSPWSCEDPLRLTRHLRGSSSSSWCCGSG